MLDNNFDYESECLLIHAGVPTIANGLVSIYYYLNNANVKTEIVNITEPKSLIFKALKRFHNLKLVGFSMNWHPQIVISIKLAELIKSMPNFEKAKIVIGGITASYFADELIQFPVVDYVIKGDGELPMLQLFKHVSKGKTNNVYSIPNLYYKKDGNTLKSKEIYIIDNDTISSLEIQAIRDKSLFHEVRHVLSCGRGCDQHCLYCGGSRQAFSKWGSGNTIIKRKKKDMCKSIDNILSNNISKVYLVNDHDGTCDFLSDCLENYDLSKFLTMTIDAWGLPTIDTMKKIFKNTNLERNFKFKLEISPEVGSDEIRKRIKSFSFTNERLECFIDQFFKHYPNPNRKVILYFSYYLPFTDKEILETRKYLYKLTTKYFKYVTEGKLTIFLGPLSTDPGSSIQQGSIKELKCEVNNLSEYYTQMLSTQFSTGNFLKHSLKDMKSDELLYYSNFFRFENGLRFSNPRLYLSLVLLFDSFENYNAFAKECFDILYELYIKPSTKSIAFSQIFLSMTGSLFGFNFVRDEIQDNGFLEILWLRILEERLLKNAKTFKDRNGNIRKHCYFGKDTVRELKYEELFDYVIELIDILLTSEVHKANIQINKRPFFHEVLKFNSDKINNIQNNHVVSSKLIPVRNPFCELKRVCFSYIFSRILEYNENLLMLGKEYFTELICDLNDQNIPKDYMQSVKKALFIENDFRKDVRDNANRYWGMILNKKDSIINEILSNLILLNYVPIEDILTFLNIPHNGPFIDDEFRFKNYDMNKLLLNNCYGKFSEICDMRLISFYLNYLKYVYKIDDSLKPEQEEINIFMSIYFPQDNVNIPPLALRDKLNNIELEILNLCDGMNTIPKIYTLLNKKYGTISIPENTMKDILVSFYSRQLIY